MWFPEVSVVVNSLCERGQCRAVSVCAAAQSGATWDCSAALLAPALPVMVRHSSPQQPRTQQEGAGTRKERDLLQVLAPAQIQQSLGERPTGMEGAVPLSWAVSECPGVHQQLGRSGFPGFLWHG